MPCSNQISKTFVSCLDKVASHLNTCIVLMYLQLSSVLLFFQSNFVFQCCVNKLQNALQQLIQ